MALTAEAYDTAAVQNRCSWCCALSEPRCRDRPTGVTEPGVLDVVPLSVATGYVRVYFQAVETCRPALKDRRHHAAAIAHFRWAVGRASP